MPHAEPLQAKAPTRGVQPIAVAPELHVVIPDLTASGTPNLITGPFNFDGDGVVGVKTNGRFRGILVPILSYAGTFPTLSVATPPVVQLVGMVASVNGDGTGLDVQDIAKIGGEITLNFAGSAEHVLGLSGSRYHLSPPAESTFPGIDLQGWPLIYASIVTPAALSASTGDPRLQLGLRLIN